MQYFGLLVCVGEKDMMSLVSFQRRGAMDSIIARLSFHCDWLFIYKLWGIEGRVSMGQCQRSCIGESLTMKCSGCLSS